MKCWLKYCKYVNKIWKNSHYKNMFIWFDLLCNCIAYLLFIYISSYCFSVHPSNLKWYLSNVFYIMLFLNTLLYLNLIECHTMCYWREHLILLLESKGFVSRISHKLINMILCERFMFSKHEIFINFKQSWVWISLWAYKNVHLCGVYMYWCISS